MVLNSVKFQIATSKLKQQRDVSHSRRLSRAQEKRRRQSKNKLYWLAVRAKAAPKETVLDRSKLSLNHIAVRTGLATTRAAFTLAMEAHVASGNDTVLADPREFPQMLPTEI
jgi:hypothetical protein